MFGRALKFADRLRIGNVESEGGTEALPAMSLEVGNTKRPRDRRPKGVGTWQHDQSSKAVQRKDALSNLLITTSEHEELIAAS